MKQKLYRCHTETNTHTLLNAKSHSRVLVYDGAYTIWGTLTRAIQKTLNKHVTHYMLATNPHEITSET